jgi:hypothetical protein
MFINIKKKDAVYMLLMCIMMVGIIFYCNNSFNKYKSQTEARLKEVCFRYDDSCDLEIGGCECIAKANDYDVMYILNKR